MNKQAFMAGYLSKNAIFSTIGVKGSPTNLDTNDILDTKLKTNQLTIPGAPAVPGTAPATINPRTVANNTSSKTGKAPVAASSADPARTNTMVGQVNPMAGVT